MSEAADRQGTAEGPTRESGEPLKKKEGDLKSKKVWLLILLSILLAGCKSTSLATNEKIIELKGNPTTGYTWLYTVGDESIIQVEEKITYLGQDGVVGAPSLFTYKIIALSEGETTLKFEYTRP